MSATSLQLLKQKLQSPKAMDNHSEEKHAFLSDSQDEDILDQTSHKRKTNISSWLRLSAEALMMIIILFLLFVPRENTSRNTKQIPTSPIPELPRRSYKFLENPKYLNEQMFDNTKATLHTLHRWIELSSDARGYVHMPDWQKYNLPQPLELKINMTHTGPGYMISAFHQLHCLSYLVQHFQQGYGGVDLTKEVAHHSAHCFDYIRQSIMCNADISLEGKTDVGPGWGSEHQCIDWDALLSWSNEHSALKWRNLMPGESVL